LIVLELTHHQLEVLQQVSQLVVVHAQFHQHQLPHQMLLLVQRAHQHILFILLLVLYVQLLQNKQMVSLVFQIAIYAVVLHQMLQLMVYPHPSPAIQVFYT
jgi:hypothetical protein